MDFDYRVRAIGCGGDEGWPHAGEVLKYQLLEWAERLQLRWDPGGGFCLHWVSSDNMPISAEHLMCHGTRTFHHWMDHTSGWTRNGMPAVLVAQPYGLDYDEKADLERAAVTYDLDLQISRDQGWYGSTTLIQLWRQGSWH
jgi:hypothetical protein